MHCPTCLPADAAAVSLRYSTYSFQESLVYSTALAIFSSCFRNRLCQCTIGFYRYIVFPGCGGVYTNGKGFIVSPNYPNNYPNKVACTHVIHGRTGYIVRVNFIDFIIEDSTACT